MSTLTQSLTFFLFRRNIDRTTLPAGRRPSNRTSSNIVALPADA